MEEEKNPIKVVLIITKILKHIPKFDFEDVEDDE